MPADFEPSDHEAAPATRAAALVRDGVAEENDLVTGFHKRRGMRGQRECADEGGEDEFFHLMMGKISMDGESTASLMGD